MGQTRRRPHLPIGVTGCGGGTGHRRISAVDGESSGHSRAGRLLRTCRTQPWQTAFVVDEEDVRRFCLGLPGVTERLSWGRPAWFARTQVARIWDDGVLTVKTDEREALAAEDPGTYFWTPHHERHRSLVLVRMDRIDEPTLEELLIEAHRLAS